MTNADVFQGRTLRLLANCYLEWKEEDGSEKALQAVQDANEVGVFPLVPFSSAGPPTFCSSVVHVNTIAILFLTRCTNIQLDCSSSYAFCSLARIAKTNKSMKVRNAQP